MEGNGQSFFTRLTKATARLAGRPAAFAIVVAMVLAWAVSGPLFGFSEAWQLTINTVTTIVTFLMVFLIQATQNRDSEAIQIKLDEIIRSQEGADNEMMGLEELDEEELIKLRESYLEMAERARTHVEKRRRRPPGKPARNGQERRRRRPRIAGGAAT
jgi:low affinity Fe/Cu permease